MCLSNNSYIQITNIHSSSEIDQQFITNVQNLINECLTSSESMTIESFISNQLFTDCRQFQQLPNGKLEEYKPVEFLSYGSFGIVMKVEKNGKYWKDIN